MYRKVITMLLCFVSLWIMNVYSFAETNNIAIPEFVAIGWATNIPPQLLVVFSNKFADSVSSEMKCIFSEKPLRYLDTKTGQMWHYRVYNRRILSDITENTKNEILDFINQYPMYLDIKLGDNPWLLVIQDGKEYIIPMD